MASKRDPRNPRQSVSSAGRPSGYHPTFAEQARKLCELGAIDRDLAEFFGVAESTINLWKTKHAEFSESIKKAKANADARVERRLFERACGFQHPELHIVQYKGKLIEKEITKQYPPDTGAAIFWLKNRQPQRWRDKVDHEHGGVGGVPIQHHHSGLTAEDAYLAMLAGADEFRPPPA